MIQYFYILQGAHLVIFLIELNMLLLVVFHSLKTYVFQILVVGNTGLLKVRAFVLI